MAEWNLIVICMPCNGASSVGRIVHNECVAAITGDPGGEKKGVALSRRGRSVVGPLATYLKWNEQVNRHFLVEANAGSALYVDPDEAFFRHLEDTFHLEPGAGPEAFLAVVRAALEDPESRDNLFARIDVAVARWRTDADEREGQEKLENKAFPPPVLALLAATVLAAQRMDETSVGGRQISSTNYYTHLRDTLGVDESHQEKLRRDFTITESYWEQLAWWLEEVDGRYGMPSARATSHRYVGLPMSQALVRSAERRAFKGMFDQYGLTPGMVIAPAEMVEVLTEWMFTRNSGASSELVAKWANAEARERIVDVAISELEAWDGIVEHAQREITGHGVPRERVRLTLLVRARHGEVETADLGFSLSRIDGDEGWSLQHQTGSAPVFPRAVSATTTFVAAYEAGVDPAELLEREIVLVHEDGRTVRHSPRRVVVLVEDEAAGCYVEVRRAVSGARHRILVGPSTADDVVDELRDLLSATGFAGNRDREVIGVPGDWLVIDGFVPALIPTDVDVRPELAALVASVTTQFHVRGGLRLPGRVRRWHSGALPDVVITIGADAGSYSLDLVDLEGGDSRRSLAKGIGRPTVVELPDDLVDGNYRLELLDRKGRAVQSEVLRLRSGRTHWIEGWDSRRNMCHDGTLLSSVQTVPVPEDPLVDGPIVYLDGRPLEANDLPREVSWANRHVRQSTGRESLSLPVPSATSCLVSGTHNFHFPGFKRGEPKGSWMTGVCSGCGAVQRTPTSHWKALRPEIRDEILRRRGRQVAERRAPVDVVPTGEETTIAQLPEMSVPSVAPTVITDALAHIGRGDVAMLLTLTSQSPDHTVDHSQYLRDLVALGTVEAVRDQTFRRTAWESSPPAVIRLVSGRYALGGAWPLEKVAGVEAVVHAVGGRFVHPEDGTMLPWFEVDDLAEVFEYVELTGIVDAGETSRELASYLPDLSEVAGALPRKDVRMEGGACQMYLVRELAWIDVADWGAPGLYRRHRGHRRDYWFRGASDVRDGTAAAVDVELGKHLVAAVSGEPLLSYDPESHRLTVPLGARLPELYERTAVLCSGRTPITAPDDFSITYPDVPADVVATLFARMSS